MMSNIPFNFHGLSFGSPVLGIRSFRLLVEVDDDPASNLSYCDVQSPSPQSPSSNSQSCIGVNPLSVLQKQESSTDLWSEIGDADLFLTSPSVSNESTICGDESNSATEVGTDIETGPFDDENSDGHSEVANKDLLYPRVHLMRLPSFMINSSEPASELEQIYNVFEKNAFKERGILTEVLRNRENSKGSELSCIGECAIKKHSNQEEIDKDVHECNFTAECDNEDTDYETDEDSETTDSSDETDDTDNETDDESQTTELSSGSEDTLLTDESQETTESDSTVNYELDYD